LRNAYSSTNDALRRRFGRRAGGVAGCCRRCVCCGGGGTLLLHRYAPVHLPTAAYIGWDDYTFLLSSCLHTRLLLLPFHFSVLFHVGSACLYATALYILIAILHHMALWAGYILWTCGLAEDGRGCWEEPAATLRRWRPLFAADSGGSACCLLVSAAVSV